MATWKKLPNGDIINLDNVTAIRPIGENCQIHFNYKIGTQTFILVQGKRPSDIISGQDYDSVR